MKYFLILSIFSAFILNSCSKDKIAKEIDRQLFEMSESTTGFTWFNNSNTLLVKSSGSGHPQPFLRTRYNAIASENLDSNGRIIEGNIFPEGSLIVKELYDDETTLGRYAILYKDSENEDADPKGWVWGYVNADRSVSVEASTKGASCISCHSQSQNIDYMLMNKFYP
jgi:hypothetical protein